MAESVGSAFLEAVFGVLLKPVVDAAKTVSSFKSNFKRMESILKELAPVIMEMETLDRALDTRKEENSHLTKTLEQGATIVQKCAKVRCWDCRQRYRYSSKLKDLEKYLKDYFAINVQAQIARDIKVVRLEHQGFSHNGSSTRVGSGSGPSSDPCVGLDVPLMGLKRDLFKNGVQVLTLTAPGGCGKTTLVKSLRGDKEVQEKFGDNILFVTVTKAPDLKDIVRKIFLKCGETPHFVDDEDAINQVEALLRARRSKPILLVLDDVWSGSESLIEKFRFPLPDYKILVSSRFEFPRFGLPHRLEMLSEEDAMSLFRHFAENSDTQDQNIVKKIVTCCKGLPLALKVIGGSLSGHPQYGKLKRWNFLKLILFWNPMTTYSIV